MILQVDAPYATQLNYSSDPAPPLDAQHASSQKPAASSSPPPTHRRIEHSHAEPLILSLTPPSTLLPPYVLLVFLPPPSSLRVRVEALSGRRSHAIRLPTNLEESIQPSVPASSPAQPRIGPRRHLDELPTMAVPRHLYSTALPEPRTRMQNNPTLLFSWWCTACALTMILFRLSGRKIRNNRLFREDKIMALSMPRISTITPLDRG